MEIPNAVKMLIWRACHDSLPTNQNLFKREIVESPLCTVCKTDPETVSHALWSCISVQDVWGSCSKRLRKVVVMEKSFKEILSYIFSVNEDEVADFAAIVYQFWRRRNSLVFEEKFLAPEIVVQLAHQAVLNYKEAV
ncbi:uncharacterized protein LOC121237469 [Juglans microcarpa x Juglans regia]|uniref:uncharacterized protein LOC121237469 n=1 Tax=Juglans microcarpa x Juglans regia TaxID=2249226 RepID=UPI001B7EBA75|nr:uncharacterized protein LOC121237469 [Juglans microcarpa x Juglans regia]